MPDPMIQARCLLWSRDIPTLAIKILKGLGEKDPGSVLRVRKYRSQNRDVVIYILYQLGVYMNKEIGEVISISFRARIVSIFEDPSKRFAVSLSSPTLVT
jgi:hypothetical protein